MVVSEAMTPDTFVVYVLLYISLYFEVFLLLSFLAHKRRGGLQAPVLAEVHALPSTTIIVPCYNEERTVGKTITSLLNLEYPQDKLKIVVVDDGSKDKTLAIARTFETDPRVQVLHKQNGGKASAMNLALSQCDTELIGCLDADSFVFPNAMHLIATQFNTHPEMSAVTPAIMVDSPKNILQMIQRAEYMVGVFLKRVFGMLDAIVVTPGPFSIFRTEAIREAGEWKHAHGTEDFEMGMRLQSMHKRIGNEPLAQVLTVSPNTLYKLYRQRLRWVYGFLMNTWDYRYMVGNAHYGNVGLFILPTAILSVFGAVYLFMLTLYTLGTHIVDVFIRFMTVGFSWHMPSINLFYLNITTMLFIVVVLVGIILFILHHASEMSKVRVRIHDTILYLALYGFIAPLWLTSALARALIGREATWRATLSQ